MKKSRGKRFESEIAKMLKAHSQVAHYRHCPDTGIHLNPIDFLCYWKGGQGLLIECKALKIKSLSHSRFVSKKERTYGEQYGRQWHTLKKCHGAGIDTYVFVNAYGWPGRDGLRGRAWAVPFEVLLEYRQTHARKSWPLRLFETCTELKKVAGLWECGSFHQTLDKSAIV